MKALQDNTIETHLHSLPIAGNLERRVTLSPSLKLDQRKSITATLLALTSSLDVRKKCW